MKPLFLVRSSPICSVQKLPKLNIRVDFHLTYSQITYYLLIAIFSVVGVNMKGVNLENSQMAGVNLRVATLKNANLQNSNLRWAILAGTDLEVSWLSVNPWLVHPMQ